MDQQESCNIDDMMARDGAIVSNMMSDDQYRNANMFDPNKVVEIENPPEINTNTLNEVLSEAESAMKNALSTAEAEVKQNDLVLE